jgi:hypothetical protein
MNSEFSSDKFLFLKHFIHGHNVPILVLNGRMVAFPSRFIFHSIEKGQVTPKQALKYLKVLARFIEYLSYRAPSEKFTPDTLLMLANDEVVHEFLNCENLTLRESNKLLLSRFFAWLEKEEGFSNRLFKS